MGITGENDGPPAKAGVAVIDVACGLHTVNGIWLRFFINLEQEKLGMSKFLFGMLQSICW